MKDINLIILDKKINFRENYFTYENNDNIINISRNILTEEDLEYFIDKNTYDELIINNNINFVETEYIIKKQMFIFIFKNTKTIKILIHSLLPYQEIKRLINITFIFYFEK